MDDFFSPTEESDPTSDFLKREQEALGGEFGINSTSQHSFDKDFSNSASNFPDLNSEDVNDDDLNSFVSAPHPGLDSSTHNNVSNVSVTNENEFESFENQYPEVELPSAPIQVCFTYCLWLLDGFCNKGKGY